MTTATEVGDVEMRIAKVVGLSAADDEPFHQYVVLEEVAGDRHLAIEIGHPEAFSLAARLGGIAWPRPMTYQFAAGLVQALGGRVRQLRIDRVDHLGTRRSLLCADVDPTKGRPRPERRLLMGLRPHRRRDR